MKETVIQVKNLSKGYRLGTIGTGSLRRDIQRWWTTSILKKDNPFFKFATDKHNVSADKHFIWALKDINFEVKKGDVLGIIGSNGSGKSTLLKILSRIVHPSSGLVRGRGKVNSLLEVGTGFNAELTGRENIFMSGFILGMTKQEVDQKFDEIVAFSGVEDFIETPVKRYSSGMYVRLAFAVAAHLNPDILIIDEVLAVGDAEFQKKCLNKMKEASRSGDRTIIFVSHDASAVASLCKTAIWLDKGVLKKQGKTAPVLKAYLESLQKYENEQYWDNPEKAPGSKNLKIKSIYIGPEVKTPNAVILAETPILCEFEFYCLSEAVEIEVEVKLYTENDVCVFRLCSPKVKGSRKVLALSMVLPGNLLSSNIYKFSLVIDPKDENNRYEFNDCASFKIQDNRTTLQLNAEEGIIKPNVKMTFSSKESTEHYAQFIENK